MADSHRQHAVSSEGKAPVKGKALHSTSAGASEVKKYSRKAATSRYRQQRRKSKLRRNIVVAIVAVFVACIGGVGAYAGIYLHNLNSEIVIDESDSVYDALATPSDSAQAEDPFYALLLGVDKSEDREQTEEYNGAYRTDTIILARVDPQEQLVTLVSIHRDTMVDLSAYGGTGYDKINSAYLYGGRELTVNVIADFAGVPISHYAEIDFDGFEAVVDALGGVDVNVEMSFYDEYLQEGLEGGQQTLDGHQALVYARSRHGFDDYGDGDRYRAKHQREVIEAIMAKVTSSDLSTLSNTVTTLAHYVQTDMSVQEIVSLATSFAGADMSSCFYSCMEPTEPVYENGGWYERVDQEAWDEMMRDVDAGLDPGEDSAAADISQSGQDTESLEEGYSDSDEGAYSSGGLEGEEASSG